MGYKLPNGYKLPRGYKASKFRPGSYGEMINNKYVEKIRFDPPTPPGTKGPNFPHFHLNRKSKHYIDPNKLP